MRAGDIKRLALVLCRCPAHALESGLVAGWGPPPLHVAASEGQVDACVLLLQRSAPPEGVDARGRTPLMLALENGHAECACALLPHATDMQATCKMGTPLIHRAAARGLCAPLAPMLARGADAALGDARGRNAAHAACAAGEPVALMHLAMSVGSGGGTLGGLRGGGGAAGAGGEAAAGAGGASAGASSSGVGACLLDALDEDGCTPALAAAHAAYCRPKACASHLHCVSTCVLLGADCSAAAVARGTAAAARAASGGSALAKELVPLHYYARTCTPCMYTHMCILTCMACALHVQVPLHYYAAALGAVDLLLQLLERLHRPPPASSSPSEASRSHSAIDPRAHSARSAPPTLQVTACAAGPHPRRATSARAAGARRSSSPAAANRVVPFG